jgi:hypothetical protein
VCESKRASTARRRQKVVQGWRLNGPAVFHSPPRFVQPHYAFYHRATSSKCAKLHNARNSRDGAPREREKKAALARSGSGARRGAAILTPNRAASPRALSLQTTLYTRERASRREFGCVAGRRVSRRAAPALTTSREQSLFSTDFIQ